MKRTFVFLFAILAFCLWFVVAQVEEHPRKIKLPTGRIVNAAAPGFITLTNSYPATMALSPDRRYAALLNQGYGTQETGVRQSIAILNLENNQLRDFPDDRLRGDDKSTRLSYFIGLAFSSDSKHLYASMSSTSESGIAVYGFSDGAVTPERFIAIPSQKVGPDKKVTFETAAVGTVSPYPAGFAVLAERSGDQLLVANNLADNVVLLEASSGKILRTFDLSASKYVPAAYPYTVIVNKQRSRAWVTLWNESSIAELDVRKGKLGRRITLWRPSDVVAPGTHPTSMLLSRSENILYVALANAGTADADGVAAVNLKSGRLMGCYRVALGKDDLPGTASLAIALNSDETRLYAASGSLNAVAVFKVNDNRQKTQSIFTELPVGFIPTGWYPSALAATGNDLLIASAKAEGSGPNNMKASFQTSVHPSEHPYIATLIGGSLQRLATAEIESKLPAFTQEVKENNLQLTHAEKIVFAGGQNPIRHVIYILKENRTYDQIFGDLEAGNGDPSLTMYGAEVTPNEHKLALQFGVLDNFYDSGDVSANGHLWSDASATSDYIEKIWPVIYRRGERPEDFGNPLEQEIPEMDDPGTGFLWDNLAKHKFSYRIYGEMTDLILCEEDKADAHNKGTTSAECPSQEIRQGEALPENVGNPRGGASPWPWAIPRLKAVHPRKAAQRDHLDPLYPNFAIDYPDQLRADEFLREFDEFVKNRGTPKELPQFILLYLPNDHTGGTRPGKPTPRASVADNDLAVGRVAEAVSRSPYWEDTAIFVLEDDAQDGADHVDAHRSIALIISKYSPHMQKPFVDHHFYTTVSMIRTIEDLIGLPPMNPFDSYASPMAPLFAGDGTQPAYVADDSNLRSGLLYQTNSKKAPGASQSSKMDFSRPDAADAQQLNAILWQDALARGSSKPASDTNQGR